MPIEKLCVCSRKDAERILPRLVVKLANQPENSVAWVTISDKDVPPLKKPEGLPSDRYLALQFEDWSYGAITVSQKEKLKTFLCNLQYNSNPKDNIFLLVNCMAGISRSVAIGKFCEQEFGVKAIYREEEFHGHPICPNPGLLQELLSK